MFSFSTSQELSTHDTFTELRLFQWSFSTTANESRKQHKLRIICDRQALKVATMKLFNLLLYCLLSLPNRPITSSLFQIKWSKKYTLKLFRFT